MRRPHSKSVYKEYREKQETDRTEMWFWFTEVEESQIHLHCFKATLEREYLHRSTAPFASRMLVLPLVSKFTVLCFHLILKIINLHSLDSRLSKWEGSKESTMAKGCLQVCYILLSYIDKWSGGQNMLESAVTSCSERFRNNVIHELQTQTAVGCM